MSNVHVAVAIVGGGPSGLTAAATLAPKVDGNVLVIEREAETGGIPRHSDHPGYGMRDLKRFMSGPAYARRLTGMAQDAGAVLETEAMVTGWSVSARYTSPRLAGCAPSRPMRWCWPLARANGPALPGLCPAIDPTGYTQPDSCRTWCTFTTAEWARAP